MGNELFVVENGQTTTHPVGEISLRNLSEDYRIVDSGNGYGIAVPEKQFAERSKEDRPPLDTQISARGATAFGTGLKADYNPQFTFPQNIEIYREIRMDAQVRSALKVFKSPVLGARWFMRPGGEAPDDKERAEFMWRNITRWATITWPQTLMEILYMVDYGFYMFEKVFTKGPDGMVRWRRFSPIHPLEVVEPIYASDGGFEAMKVLVGQGDNAVEKDIPIGQLLIFTFDKESGGYEGISALRSVYKHWFIKENLLKIDAIQKERHSIGIPIIILPMNYVRDKPNQASPDVAAAHQIGENLRGNESAHVVLPPLWELKFARLEGHNVDPLRSAEYHGRMIYENFLVNFTDDDSGTRHIGGDTEIFMKGTRFLADIIKDVINMYAIPQLYDWNWGEPDGDSDYPQLDARRLGDTTDWRTISFAIRNLVGSGIIIPDDDLEASFRDEMDLPDADTSTSREVSKPQGSPVGLPRQSKPSSQPPKANAGTDKSGG